MLLLYFAVQNAQVTQMFSTVAASFGCNMVQAVLSHQMKRFVIDGNKVIISKSDLESKVDEVEFQVGDVFAVDVVVSTGEGKPKEMDERTTIFKRAVEQSYQLKLKVRHTYRHTAVSRRLSNIFVSQSLLKNYWYGFRYWIRIFNVDGDSEMFRGIIGL